MSEKNKKSLADALASLLVTAPSNFDPEYEDLDSTSAILKDPLDSPENADDKEEELLSTFRKQNINLLADVDTRYAGKKSSRKKVEEYSEDNVESDSDNGVNDSVHTSESDEDGNENVEDGNENDEDGNENESEENSSNESEEYDDGMEEEETDESNEDNTIESDILANENVDNYKHMNDTNVSARVRKGLSVRNQLNIWENLLEMRIQLQKSVLAANKMPNSENYADIKKSGGTEFENKVKETRGSVENLLDKFLLLQQLVVKKYPETKKLNKKEATKELDNSDEEIPSDTDLSEESESDVAEETPRKKRKLKDYENDIGTMHKVYKNYRNDVIQKWHDKTQIAITKSNTGSHSIINHIEHTLNDRDKLLRRTQLKRGDYKIIGEDQEESEHLDKGNTLLNNTQDQHNKEIFDDSDYYHQLLRELIEVKSTDLMDPVQLARQWVQLQNLRSKMKRKIDTRATKGRKIRYAVHHKLVNFMAPIEENTWTDNAKNELYSSLFGKIK